MAEIKKYLSLDRLSEYDALIKEEITSGDATVKSYVDTEVAKKANSSHEHDDRYYTESEIDSKLSTINTSITNIQSGTIVVKEAEHADSADEAAHAVAADSATKATQDGNGKVIADTYETKTDAASKLTEAKTYTDTVAAGKSDSTHKHDSDYDAKGSADAALASAKEYTNTKTAGMATTTVVDNKISAHNTSTSAHGDIRTLISDLTTKVNNFLDVDDATTDQLSEVLTLIDNNKGTLESLTSNKVNVSDIIDNLTTANANKVLSANQGVALKALIDALQGEFDSHTHVIADVSGLQSALDGKAAASHGAHVTFDSTNKPKMDGTAAFGTSSSVARADHVHPTDTSRASKSEFDTHAADTTKHITATERTNWNAAYTHSQAAHAPSNAEKNQNAFSNVKVGSVTVAADTATDTFEIAAGTGISVAGDATNDKVTITNSGVIAVSTGSANGTISVNTNGTAADVAVKGLGSAAYTNSSAYATHDHTHTVDSALSASSTNPVQNKVVNNALSSLTSTVSANTQSIGSHTTAINNLQTEINSYQEITSAEIQNLFK